MEDLKQQFIFAENLTNRVYKLCLDVWDYKPFYNSRGKCQYYTSTIDYLVRHLSKTYMIQIALDCALANKLTDKEFLNGLQEYFSRVGLDPYQFLLFCVFVASYGSVLENDQNHLAYHACKVISGVICAYMRNKEFKDDGWEYLEVAAMEYACESEETRVRMLKESDLFAYLKSFLAVACLTDIKPKHSDAICHDDYLDDFFPE